MSSLMVTEVFRSLQGEGLYCGTPSVFVRFYGCNFTCSGFGMPAGKKSEERLQVQAEKYQRLEDVPLVSTGCDSFTAWDKRFLHLSKKYDAEALAEWVSSLCMPLEGDEAGHVVLTGGEPLLIGRQTALVEFVEALHLKIPDLVLTFETNATQPLTPPLEAVLRKVPEVVMCCSPKLSNSGEPKSERLNPGAVISYLHVARKIFFKFVVEGPEQFREVRLAITEYQFNGVYAPVYLMQAGSMDSPEYRLACQALAAHCKDTGFRYTGRLHVDLFQNAWGT